MQNKLALFFYLFFFFLHTVFVFNNMNKKKATEKNYITNAFNPQLNNLVSQQTCDSC